jgi:hypothetical protein
MQSAVSLGHLLELALSLACLRLARLSLLSFISVGHFNSVIFGAEFRYRALTHS